MPELPTTEGADTMTADMPYRCGVYHPDEPHVCRCIVLPDHVDAFAPHRCECGRVWPVRRVG